MTGYAIADVAALVGEPTRAAILLALIDGRALPAGVLAGEAGISAAATSLHLAKLTRAGLLIVEREGRHRYYRLANGDVAHALEALGAIATAGPPRRSFTRAQAALREARSCYDHLAGALGVAFADKLARDRLLQPSGERAYAIAPEGARWLLETMRIDATELAAERRPLARRCIDWTERRPHVAGALGAALLDRVLAMRWATRVTGTRALRITPGGRAALAELGITVAR